MIFKISAFYFFYFAAIGVYVMYMPSLLEGLGYTPFEIGVVFAAGPLSRFIAPFFFISWFHLNRTAFYAGLTVSTVCSLFIYTFIAEFWVLLGLMIILGFFWSIMLPFVEVLALEQIGKEHYGKARLFGSVGFIVIGLVLGRGALELDFSMQLYVFSIAATMVFGLMLAKYIEKEIVREPVRFDPKGARYNLWIALFLSQVGFGFFYNFFTIYELEHKIPLETISYLWTFGVLVEIVMFRWQRFAMRWELLTLIRFSVLLGAVRWLMVHLFPDSTPVLYLAQSIHAFNFALLHTASIAYINAIYTNRQLAQQFYVGLTFGLGAFIGSLLSGSLYGENLFLYASLITFVAYGLLLLEKRSVRAAA